MIILIAGIFILIFGFFAPYVSHGELPSLFFFWGGFLLILWSKEFTSPKPLISKWARRGLLCHAIGVSLFAFFLGIVFMGEELRHGYFVDIIFRIGDLILSPINNIFNYISPLVSTKHPDGSVSGKISFLRTTLTSFLNILLYILIGGLIGHKLQKEANSELKNK